MSLLLSKISEGKIHIAKLHDWRRTEHPELPLDKLYASLTQLIDSKQITVKHDPQSGDYYEVTK